MAHHRAPSEKPAAGTVAHREYYGHDSVVLVRLDGSDVTMRVRCPGAARLALGDRVALDVDGDVVAWTVDADEADDTAD